MPERDTEIESTETAAPVQPVASEADPAAVELAAAETAPAVADTEAETAASETPVHASASARAYDKGGPEIAATPEAMGEHTVGEMKKANMDPGAGGQYDLDHG